MNDVSAFYNRIKKNISKHKGWLKSQGIEAYRAYEKDIPEYPYIVDFYKDHAVVYEQGKRLDAEEATLSEKHQAEIVEALHLLGFKDQNIHLKVRERKQGTEQYEKLAEKETYFIVQENQARLWVNLEDYLDTGLFLDHRPIRQKIYKLAKNKTFLNLFSYTGSVSVFAALGGAHVTSVDMSRTYMNWARQNFEINFLKEIEHNFITDDALKFLDYHHKKYDLILLDPPTFSNSKRMEGTLDILRDHMDLVSRTMNLLNDDGLLIFSTNYRDFKIDPSLEDEFDIRDITAATIPQDFRNPKIHHAYEVRFKK
ncbi:MAG: class I SAM-dependent methyltransferase [Bacteriovoracaceae bacterium]